jgi:hypothetical protein
MKARFNILTMLFTLAWFCTILLSGCSNREKLQVDISEGYATNTLREFAHQTKVEILFDLRIVEDVKTNPVKGVYDPYTALRMMLEDTPLEVDFESESGAYAVFRKKS